MQVSNFGGSILTNFSFEFFCELFTEDASLLLYHGAKSQNDQELKARGPASRKSTCKK